MHDVLACIHNFKVTHTAPLSNYLSYTQDTVCKYIEYKCFVTYFLEFYVLNVIVLFFSQAHGGFEPVILLSHPAEH